MSSKNKYAADCSWADVSTYVREHTRSTGFKTVIVLLPGAGPQGKDVVEVRLLPEAEDDLAKATIIVRAPWEAKNRSRQMSALLHSVANAYWQLEMQPWLWPAHLRRQYVPEPWPANRES